MASRPDDDADLRVPVVVHHAWAESALRCAREEDRRLRRRRFWLSALALLGFGTLTCRGLLGLRPSGQRAVAADIVGEIVAALVISVVSCTALLLAWRAALRLKQLRQDLFTLCFLRDVLDHETGPGLIALEHPYRSSARGPERAARTWSIGSFWRRTLPCATSAAGALRPVGAALALVAAGGLVAVLAGSLEAPTPRSSQPRAWRFLDDVSDPAHIGFTVGNEESGVWVLDRVADATGARALVNLGGVPSERPATAVVDDLSSRDVRVRTRCKASSDRAEQACGVVFRHVDSSTHYLARVDAVAGTVSLSVVVADSERRIEVAPVEVEPATWQELGVEAHADHLLVFLNGEAVIDAYDPTLASAGAVGLWVPADCIAYFDDLRVQPLAASLVHPSELLPFLL